MWHDRLLGSAHDAEDALLEPLLAAWQGLGGFAGRPSIRTWLYRVATTRCMNALRSSRRRPSTERPLLDPYRPEPARLGNVLWLEPYSALKRARATLQRRLPPVGEREPPPPPNSAHEREVVERFSRAFENQDVGAVVALLT